MSSKAYVLGFVFDNLAYDARVTLILKSKPPFQKGKFNGIGGSIEPGEQALDAMVREYREETGVTISSQQWHPFGELAGDTWLVYLFTAAMDERENDVRTTTEEVVVKFCKDLPPRNTLSNVPWLISMAWSIASDPSTNHHLYYKIKESDLTQW